MNYLSSLYISNGKLSFYKKTMTLTTEVAHQHTQAQQAANDSLKYLFKHSIYYF
jgi:hypothetical protein